MRRAFLLLAVFAIASLVPPDLTGGEPATAPTFDSKDARKTFAWFDQRAKGVLDARKANNYAAATTLVKRLDKDLESLVSKEIDWNVMLGIAVQDWLTLQVVPDKQRAPYTHLIQLHRQWELDQQRAFERADSGYTRGFPIPDADWFLTIKAGDPVRLRGRIQHARIRAGYSVDLHIWLTGYSLLPSEKK